MTRTTNHVQYFDFLRVIAAVAVIAIHVLGPYRHQIGDIALSEWIFAVGVNGASRWAVPVFILITGALMLSDTRPFSLSYFVKKRVSKVLVPFIIWSLFYVWLSGLSSTGYDAGHALDVLKESYHHETYYHLGFFYYFIPLYILVPFLRPLAQRLDHLAVAVIGISWIVLTGLYLNGWSGVWRNDLVLYGGYLWLGYWLYNYRVSPIMILTIGLASLVVTEYKVLSISIDLQQYRTLGWFSYKTANTVLIALAVFTLGKLISATLPESANAKLGEISKYTLGIYLIHPIFLWPVREFDWYLLPSWVMIPLLTAIVFMLSYWSTAWLAKWKPTRWLVP